MRILIVAATEAEVAPLVAVLGGAVQHGGRTTGHKCAGHEIHVLTTGVGMVATAAWCSRALSERSYGLALNVGVCGSFDRALGPGHVVHVVSDRIAELGAEDDEEFLSIEELHLAHHASGPHAHGELVNVSPPDNHGLLALTRVAGITVNTVHGNERSIAKVVARFHPQVESMEGAAFMYACMIHAIPFAQVRAVSNLVERRNRDAWRMAEAVACLTAAVVRILEVA